MNTKRTVVLSDDDIGVSSTVMDLIKPSNLSSISGGGGRDPNWLGKLPLGARFLFKSWMPQNPSAPDIGVQMAEVQVKYKECTQLFDGLNKPIKYIVDNVAFSTTMRCVEMLEPFVQQEGTANVLVIASNELDRPD